MVGRLYTSLLGFGLFSGALAVSFTESDIPQSTLVHTSTLSVPSGTCSDENALNKQSAMLSVM